ncbi:MAG: hypothetical protein ABFC56_11450 [Clostridiaceae bacterium]
MEGETTCRYCRPGVTEPTTYRMKGTSFDRVRSVVKIATISAAAVVFLVGVAAVSGMISPVHANDTLQVESTPVEENNSDAPIADAPNVNDGNDGAAANVENEQETGTDQETPPAQQSEQPKTNVTYTDARVYVASANLDQQANEIIVDAYITHDKEVVFSESEYQTILANGYVDLLTGKIGELKSERYYVLNDSNFNYGASINPDPNGEAYVFDEENQIIEYGRDTRLILKVDAFPHANYFRNQGWDYVLVDASGWGSYWALHLLEERIQFRVPATLTVYNDEGAVGSALDQYYLFVDHPEKCFESFFSSLSMPVVTIVDGVATELSFYAYVTVGCIFVKMP